MAVVHEEIPFKHSPLSHVDGDETEFAQPSYSEQSRLHQMMVLQEPLLMHSTSYAQGRLRQLLVPWKLWLSHSKNCEQDRLRLVL